MEIKLRDFQEVAVNDIRAAFAKKQNPRIAYRKDLGADPVKRVLFVLSTGGGKTFTFAYIIHGAAGKGNRTLTLVHRKELMRQSSLSLAALDVHHGLIAPDNKVAEVRRAQVKKLHKPFIRNNAITAVASIQTLIRRLPWATEFKPALGIIDEAHHATAGSWRRVIDELPETKWLGVTATPIRTDGTGLGDVFDAMVLGPSMAELIDDGYLCRPRVFAPPLRADLSGVHRSKGDLRTDEQADILDTPTITGDAVDHYRKLAPGRPAIVFCCNVKHAKHVAAEFRAAGYRFEAIYGDMDDNERDRLIYGLADGSVQGLVSVDTISEGTDIPVAEVAIFLRRTESEGLYMQQGGRVLRPVYADGYDLSTPAGRLDAIANGGKPYGIIIDHVGNTLIHGRLDEEREWTLEGRPKKAGKKADGETELKILQCPNCYHVHDPAPTCPACGHAYEAKVFQPKQVDGELVELVESEEERKAREARQAARRAQGTAQTVDDMVKKLGYSRGRAEKILEARQEKQRLQRELSDLCGQWVRKTGGNTEAAFGFRQGEIRSMKPKALRESIQKISEALFMGSVNDNEQDAQKRA